MIFAHIMDNNLGDANCCPLSYFKFENAVEKDFRIVPCEHGDPVVIGGGGMLHPGVDDWILKISKLTNTYLWGAGLNYHDPVSDEHVITRINECELSSLRDRRFCEKYSIEYVPCVSCMSPLFDVQYEKKHDVGVYMHKDHIFRLEGLPVMDNFNSKPLSKVIEFLGSCKKIITNSYHGAYWSHLLGIPYEIYKPFSNRFSDIPKESLSECRDRNVNFYNMVKRLEHINP